MDVYDVEQDKGKNLFQQLKEALVGAGSTVLENRPRSEVATVASLSRGRSRSPRSRSR